MKRNIQLINCGYNDVNPMTCGIQECTPAYSCGPAVREYFLLHYVISGKGKFVKSDKVYNLQKGNIFLIRPNEMTLYVADADEPWEYCWIGFESKLNINGILKQDVYDALFAERTFLSMLECETMNAAKEMYLCGKIFELLAILSRHDSYEASGPLFVLKAQNFINANYQNEISVSSLAESLNVNRSYFSLAFKRYIGKSPQQYIVDSRLEKAAELITVYGYKPKETAVSVGYKDIFNFSKMFKHKFGVAPSKYMALFERGLQ